MGTAICQDGDLDFRLIFGEEDSDSPSPRSTLHTADLESDDPSLCNDVTTDTLTLNLSNTCVTGGAGSGMGCARAGMHSPPPRRSSDHDINGTFLSQPSRFIPLGGSRFLECPSIRITSDSPSNSDGEQEEQGRRDIWDERPHRDQLFLPPDPFVYRDSFLSPSPASSHSSWSILSSEASSCDSLGQMCEEVERELNEAASRFTLASPLGSPRGSPKPWSVHNDEFWPSGPSGPPASSREELLSPYPQGQISRPTSPCGKRRYSNSNEDSIHHTSSPSPSPSRRGSLGDENLSSEAEASPKPPEHNQQTISNSQERGDNIPQKARRTSAEQTVAPVRPEESSSPAKTFSSGASVCLSDENNVMFPQTRKENAGMDYLAVPSALAWSKARVGGQSPVFRSSSLPPLDWPLPCQYEGLELRIEVQPRTHHRAHYETEGSRGAVKASPGGHPIVKRRDAAEIICHGVLGQTEEKRKEKIYMTEDVTRGYNEKPLTLQMFIGTADERNLRPHAFYQVHRITGKMVATPSYEALVGSTKVLEMSLLPENNMCANIDCAGILKLRNSDIELRKGETDIGRKNTRVRLVFRVHIPQGGGKGISLQVASIPIECSQRSAQELPQVENYSLSACSVNGREELLLCGSNFLSDSKVVFIEKGPANTLSGCEKAHVVHLDPFVFTMSGITGVTLSLSSLLLLDGKLQWEEEAKVNRLKSNESLLSVQVPEYCNKEITRPLQVYFYISNGRRKRSPMQSFRYLPIIFKEEQLPEMTLHRFPPSSLPPPSHIILDPGHMELSTSFESSVTSNLSEAPMEVSPYYISPHQERMFSGASDCSAGNSSFLGCYFNPTVLSELKCPPSYPENGGDMSITLPFQTSNSALPPSPVPWSPQPRSSHPTSSNTFSGSLHPHLNTNNKLEERGTGSHANYQSSPILPSLEFDSTPHFGPGYEPYPSCPPPTYTTLGEVNRLDTMHSKQSTTSPEMSRTEQSTSNQQFTQSTLSNHSTNPVHALRSKIDEVGTVSHTGFSTTNSSLSLSCKDNGGSQTFSTDYHNMSSCSPSQLTTLCPSTHPATFSSSPSPTIPSTPDPGHEATSDTTVCIPSNRNQKDVCYQEHLEEYTKSANSGGGEVRKEHSQVFENPFHPIPIQGITLEEVSEFIGQDLHSFPERHQN